jgi:uncharacterized membrane protein
MVMARRPFLQWFLLFAYSAARILQLFSGKSGKRLLLLPVIAGIIMTTWDLSMEAVWADIGRAWIWRDGGPFFGVPCR